MENAFTVYDAMAKKGVFRANRANIDSRLPDGRAGYKKQEWPKMLYHPTGMSRVTTQARREQSPTGVITIPAQTELINQTVEDQTEYDKLIAEGWHKHPGDAVAARPKTDEEVETAKDDEIAALRRKLASAEEKIADLE